MITGSIPTRLKFQRQLRALIDAARKLDHTWDGPTAGYPDYLPSFDEFVADLQAWHDRIEEKTQADYDGHQQREIECSRCHDTIVTSEPVGPTFTCNLCLGKGD